MANITIELLLAGVRDTMSHQMLLSTERLDFGEKTYSKCYAIAFLIVAIIFQCRFRLITLLQFGSSHLNGRRPKCSFTCCAKCSLRLNTYDQKNVQKNCV